MMLSAVYAVKMLRQSIDSDWERVTVAFCFSFGPRVHLKIGKGGRGRGAIMQYFSTRLPAFRTTAVLDPVSQARLVFFFGGGGSQRKGVTGS